MGIRSHDDLTSSSYRSGVGIIMVNQENKIFVGQRIDSPSSAWQMPQGGVDEHESITNAMFRELKEEIGTAHVEILAQSKECYTYNLPTELAEKLWGGHYIGQQQTWFLVRFLGKDSDINIQTTHPEFREWKWVSKNEAISLIVPFKKELYQKVFDELWPFI